MLVDASEASVDTEVVPWLTPIAQYSTPAAARLACMVVICAALEELGPHTNVSSSRFTPVAVPLQNVVSARLMAVAKLVDEPPACEGSRQSFAIDTVQ